MLPIIDDTIKYSGYLGGGKIGQGRAKRHLCLYSYVEDYDDSYIEFKINNITAQIDMEYEYLLKEYSWRLDNNFRHIETVFKRNGKTVREYMKKLIMNCDANKVKYIDGNPLNLRKANLEIVIPKHEIKKETEYYSISEWFGGKPQGTIFMINNIYVVKLCKLKTETKFYIKDYTTKNDALLDAKRFLYLEAMRKGLILNQLRCIRDKDYNTFLEVKLNHGYTFYCNMCDHSFVENHEWKLEDENDDYRIYAIIDSNKVYLHQLLLSASDKNIEHINGNKLDNRRTNLKLIHKVR